MAVHAVLYARTSPGEHGKRSIPEQLRLAEGKARELAGGQECLVHGFSDQGASGDIPPLDRPGFAEALQLARDYKAAFFVCLDPDRFSRDVYQALGAAGEIDRTGARLAFVLHEYDMSPEGRLFFTLRVAIAEYEKHKIKERTQRGIRAKLMRGGLPWAPRPYGYSFNKETDQLVIVDDQARWIREMYRWVIEEQIGPYVIAQRLNDMGVPSPRGNWWYKQAMGRILRNPVYKGELVVNKTDQTGMRKNRYLPPDQRQHKRQRPRAEWVTLPAPAIVEAETWSKAQRILDDGRRRRPGAPLTPYLLTGICVCGICGAPCHGFSNGAGRRYYVCSRRHQGIKYLNPEHHPNGPCQLPYLRVEPIESLVRSVVKTWLHDLDAFQSARQAASVQPGQADVLNNLARLKKARQDLEAEWDRRVEAFQRGWVRDKEKAQAEIAAVKRRAAALRRQEEAWLAKAEPAAASQNPDPAKCAAAESMRQRLDRMDDEDWRHSIAMVVGKVQLVPGSVPRIMPR